MNGFERIRAEKRARILDIAVELFQAHGFRRVPVSEIASKAGVSQVTIYNHFVNKHRLIREAALEIIRRATEEYRRILNSDAPYFERLHRVVIEKAKLVDTIGREIMEVIYDESGEIIDDIAELQRTSFAETAVPFLQEGKQKGYLSPSISDEAIAMYFEILGVGITKSTEYQKRAIARPELAKEIQALIINGIASRASETSLPS